MQNNLINRYKPSNFMSRFLYNYVIKVGGFVAKHPILFYILNFTWGLLYTLIGLIIFIVMLPFGKIKKFEYVLYLRTRINGGWGFEQGITFMVSKDSDYLYVQKHELGHTIQNAVLGPFQLFIVAIPSVIRYWYRYIHERKGKEFKTTYDEIWFEYTANELGTIAVTARVKKEVNKKYGKRN